jgi:hypothetical protein
MTTTQGIVDPFPWSLNPLPVDPTFALIRTVETVDIGYTEGENPSLMINASGTVPTGGWHFGLLAPKISTEEVRADEIWELLFLGRLPIKGSVVLQRITRIEGALVVTLPSWAKAIRVVASVGEKTVSIPSVQDPRPKAVTFNSKPMGGFDNFPW